MSSEIIWIWGGEEHTEKNARSEAWNPVYPRAAAHHSDSFQNQKDECSETDLRLPSSLAPSKNKEYQRNQNWTIEFVWVSSLY